jgi:integrase
LHDHTESWRESQRFFDLHCGGARWREGALPLPHDLAPLPLDKLTRFEIQAWVNNLGREVGRPTANRAFNLVRASINWGISMGLCKYEMHPCRRIKTFKLQPRTGYNLSPAEWANLAAGLESCDSHVRDAIKLLLFTGARKMTVLSMRWEEINLREGVWRVPATKKGNKTQKDLAIALSADAVTILESRIFATRETGWVFPSRDSGSGHLINIDAAWRKIRNQLGLQKYHLHDLRHTTASWMADAGANAFQIQKQLGHASVTTSQVYTDPSNRVIREVLDRALNRA